MRLQKYGVSMVYGILLGITLQGASVNTVYANEMFSFNMPQLPTVLGGEYYKISNGSYSAL